METGKTTDSVQSEVDRHAALHSERIERLQASARFEASLPFLDSLALGMARRNGLSPADGEDFASEVKLKLMLDDYRLLRRWRWRARLESFLRVVVGNSFRDYRIRKWGRWRPTRKALELGQEAVWLETLTDRDGFALSEAIEILRSRYGSSRTRLELLELAQELPCRVGRKVVPCADFDHLASTERASSRVETGERIAVRRRALRVLCRAIGSQPASVVQMLRLRYWEGFTLRAVAEAMDEDPRRIYRLHARSLQSLRKELEEAGLGWIEVEQVLGWDDPERADATPPPGGPVRPGSGGE